LARALANAGADLVLTSRKRETLAEFAAEIEALGRRVLALDLDVRDEESIRRMTADAEAAFGQIAILVNNAGCNIRKPALEVTWDNWNQILETNLRGTFFVAQAVARGMIAKGYGRIVNKCFRLRGPRALWRQPRRRAPVDHEPRRRMGKIRRHGQLPRSRMVSYRAKQDSL
jgi:NADP-dependent 3-hydroxy acid dehydrogenase YdfG